MIRKMMWQPDTCGCQLVLEYDSEEDDATRVYKPVAGTKLCAAHQGDPAQMGDVVFAENRRKNYAVAALCEHLGGEDKVNPTEIVWLLDDQRKVTVSHPDVQDKAAALAFLRSKGIDAVVE